MTAASALLRLAGRRTEQFLQVIDSLRKQRPFAGEGVLRAVRCLDSRGLLDRACHRHRYLLGLGPQRDLLHALLQFLLLMTLGGERSRNAVAALVLEIDGVLLVDMFLLFRRRVRARDIEGAVLHEVVIGVAAAYL